MRTSLRSASLLSASLLSIALTACHPTPGVAVPARLTGFVTPESALHDEARDVYWVSNIGAGGPLGHDGDGFLSRVHPDGRVEAGVIGPQHGAHLDAPKGMALVGDTLYVADIDRVRAFDADTGAPTGEIAIAGAEFLNDVAAAPDGTLYVSDTGADANLTPTGHDAVYRIRPGAAPERWLSGATLGNPNGLAVTADAVWLVTFGSGELIELALDGTIRARHAAPQGQGSLDGIEPLADGRFLITSWAAKAILIATRDGEFAIERDGVESPADLGLDRSRGRVLLPLMNANTVLIDDVHAPRP